MPTTGSDSATDLQLSHWPVISSMEFKQSVEFRLPSDATNIKPGLNNEEMYYLISVESFQVERPQSSLIYWLKDVTEGPSSFISLLCHLGEAFFLKRQDGCSCSRPHIRPSKVQKRKRNYLFCLSVRTKDVFPRISRPITPQATANFSHISSAGTLLHMHF